jgi:hypothetical protein
LKQVGFGVAVVEEIVGAGFTTTMVVAGALVHPAAVAVKVYVPACVRSNELREVLADVAEKETGPVQLKVAPMSDVPVNVTEPPTQAGPLLEALAEGIALTSTDFSAVT